MKLQVLFCGLFEFREFVFCFEIWFFFYVQEEAPESDDDMGFSLFD
jgi:hypothetical protein